MASKFATVAETELACGVCFQFFVKPHEPKNLPKCPHILCQICLQKMTEGELMTVKCPHCNKTSPLPDEGIDGLTTSLALRNLAERHPKGTEQYKEYLRSQLIFGQEKTTNKVIKLKKLIKETQDVIKVEEQEIEKTVEAVMLKAQELINQLKNTSGLDQLQEQLAKLETEMKHIETSQTKLETMTNEEFHTQTSAITNQIKKLKIDEVKEIATTPSVGRFIAYMQLGRIVKPRKLELVQEIGGFTCAFDVTSNANGILAVCDWKSNPQEVSVFQKDSTGYKKQSKFPVHPWSEVGCLDISISEGEYLVTKCASGFDVYSSDGRFQKSESVIDEQSGQGKICVSSGSICSTKDGRILVGSDMQVEGEEFLKGIVTIHDKGGSLMKTIPIDIIPNQITDINGTHVAICSDKHDKVCIYDMQTGKETLSFDVQMINSTCYDKQSDCLLTAGFIEKDEHGKVVFGSGVIDQYCRISGKMVAHLAHGLLVPYGMTITEDNMLAVADRQTVKLYKME